MDLENVEVTFQRYDHGTNYDDEYLRYENVDNYFFENNRTKEIYRWSMNGNGKYCFLKGGQYILRANVQRKNKYGTRITHAKLKRISKNTYGDLVHIEVKPN